MAAVSRTLRRLLIDRMATPGVGVTMAPPDVTVANVNGSRINLYLYQVLEHAQLKNQALPGREHPGTYGQPPLSLTLRYLMTSHARSDDQPDSDIIAQATLGDAMLVLHDFGGRMDDLVLLTNLAGAIGDPVLDAALRREFERVKLTLQPASLEEMSKLWAAMPQANFRRSVIYDVSVVQIEGRLPRRRSQPVRTRRILPLVSRPPVILDAYRTPPPPPAPVIRELRLAVGDEVTIEHAPTTADRLYVRFGPLEPIRVALPTGGVVRLTVPNDQYPIDLDNPVLRPIAIEDRVQPGTLEIVLLGMIAVDGVEGGLDRGQPFSVDRALRSNTALLQLAPRVTAVTPAFATAAGILRLTGDRLWSPTLPSDVIVSDVAVPVRQPQPGDPWAAPTPTQVEVPVGAIAAVLAPRPTPYPVWAQVNGVRSRETIFNFRLDP